MHSHAAGAALLHADYVTANATSELGRLCRAAVTKQLGVRMCVLAAPSVHHDHAPLSYRRFPRCLFFG